MSGIRNVAKELSIRKAIDFTPGCACLSIQPQADFYLVHIAEYGGSRVIKVDDAAHALRLLNRTEPENEQ